MTDVAGYFLTRSEGDLEFANDPAGLINAALLASVVVSGLSFIVELGLRCSWETQEFRNALPFMQALHFACEDSFQTILYSTVAGAQAGGHTGASGATVFAVLQALGFVAMKLNDMYASRARTVTAGVACCLTTVATITVIALVATSGASADCDDFQCPAGTSAVLGLADEASCVASPCEVVECCVVGEEVEGATALEAAHELDDSSVDSGGSGAPLAPLTEWLASYWALVACGVVSCYCWIKVPYYISPCAWHAWCGCGRKTCQWCGTPMPLHGYRACSVRTTFIRFTLPPCRGLASGRASRP